MRTWRVLLPGKQRSSLNGGGRETSTGVDS